MNLLWIRRSVWLSPLLLVCILVSFSFFSSEKMTANYTLILFEGSDWCRNCIRLEKTILSKDTFISFAEKEQIEIERIDFPQRKKLDAATKAYNASMAEKYGFKGVFPTLLLVNNQTNAISEIPYRTEDKYQFIRMISNKISENQ